MNACPTLIALLTATALSACGPGHDHDHEHDGASEHSAEPESVHGNPPAANVTEAFYGDEAPVIIEAVPEDDHGHDHGEEDEHPGGDHGSEPHAH